MTEKQTNAELDKFYRKNSKIKKLIDDINLIDCSNLTDGELKKTKEEFKKNHKTGKSLEKIMPELFARTKEVMKRFKEQEKTFKVMGQDHKWEMIPYDVQFIGAAALHENSIAEMKTGEGKTLVATMPLMLNALAGKSHLATVNEYLAQRDFEWMNPVFEALGFTAGLNLSIEGYRSAGLTEDMLKLKKEAYAADIIYGVNSEFGFDYLRDNTMVSSPDYQAQTGLDYIIVDEADELLIDDAMIPLILSSMGADNREEEQLYKILDFVVKKMVHEQKSKFQEYMKGGHLFDISKITENDEEKKKFINHLQTIGREQLAGEMKDAQFEYNINGLTVKKDGKDIARVDFESEGVFLTDNTSACNFGLKFKPDKIRLGRLNRDRRAIASKESLEDLADESPDLTIFNFDNFEKNPEERQILFKILNDLGYKDQVQLMKNASVSFKDDKMDFYLGKIKLARVKVRNGKCKAYINQAKNPLEMIVQKVIPFFKMKKVELGKVKEKDKNARNVERTDIDQNMLKYFKVFGLDLPVSEFDFLKNKEMGFEHVSKKSIHKQRHLVEAFNKGHAYFLISKGAASFTEKGLTELEKRLKSMEFLPEEVPFFGLTVEEAKAKITDCKTPEERYKMQVGLENLLRTMSHFKAHANVALDANATMHHGVDYVNRRGKIILIEQQTGRLTAKKFSGGLHQAIEAKEGLEVTPDSPTLGQIAHQNYFKLYKKVAGMTGTAIESKDEFKEIFGMQVIQVPTNKPMIRKDHAGKLYVDSEIKFKWILNEIITRHKKGQPLLIGTRDVNKSVALSEMLNKIGIKHNLLNAQTAAEDSEHEAKVVAGAGQKGAVTIATNMAGRGTDIKLGQGVKDFGGLCVIGTEKNESPRVDRQLSGRAGRQGDPGESLYFSSFEDNLMRMFAPVNSYQSKFLAAYKRDPKERENPLSEMFGLKKLTKKAQESNQIADFESRKEMLKYDGILDKQRRQIYALKNKFLRMGESEESKEYVVDAIRDVVAMGLAQSNGDIARGLTGMSRLFGTALFVCQDGTDIVGVMEQNKDKKEFLPLVEKIKQGRVIEIKEDQLEDSVALEDALCDQLEAIYGNIEKQIGTDRLRYIESRVLYGVLDNAWKSYMEDISNLKDTIHLRRFSQREPTAEFAKESAERYEQAIDDFYIQTVHNFFNLESASEEN